MFGDDKNKRFKLGEVQFCNVEKNLWVANMIAQVGVRSRKQAENGALYAPIRYSALRKCLTLIATTANGIGASIHAPRIGTNLAGGNWQTIAEIISHSLVKSGIHVHIYDL